MEKLKNIDSFTKSRFKVCQYFGGEKCSSAVYKGSLCRLHYEVHLERLNSEIQSRAREGSCLSTGCGAAGPMRGGFCEKHWQQRKQTRQAASKRCLGQCLECDQPAHKRCRCRTHYLQTLGSGYRKQIGVAA